MKVKIRIDMVVIVGFIRGSMMYLKICYFVMFLIWVVLINL